MLRQMIGFISLIKLVLFPKLLKGFKASFTAEYPKTERSDSANSIMCLAHPFASLNSEILCTICQTIRVLLHNFDIPRNLTASHERALYPLLQCPNLYSRPLKAQFQKQSVKFVNDQWVWCLLLSKILRFQLSFPFATSLWWEGDSLSCAESEHRAHSLRGEDVQHGFCTPQCPQEARETPAIGWTRLESVWTKL